MRARIELLKNFGPVPTVSTLTLRRYAAGHADGAAGLVGVTSVTGSEVDPTPSAHTVASAICHFCSFSLSYPFQSVGNVEVPLAVGQLGLFNASETGGRRRFEK